MAQIEAKEGVQSTYLVQITNKVYNALSMQNRNMIGWMAEMGHKIDLHYHLNGIINTHAPIFYVD